MFYNDDEFGFVVMIVELGYLFIWFMVEENLGVIC